LKQIGCDVVQGFYVSSALPAEEFAKLLANFDGASVLHGRLRPRTVSAS
jgi:hypothetical protein